MEERIMGKIPNISLLGFHTVPKKFPRPISKMVGIPFPSKYTQISATAAMETQAVNKNTTCMIFSESEVDKRSRLYKKVKELGYAAELERQAQETAADDCYELVSEVGSGDVSTAFFFKEECGDKSSFMMITSDSRSTAVLDIYGIFDIKDISSLTALTAE